MGVPRKRKKETPAQLAETAARLLQRIVRMKAAVASGHEYIACVSCGKFDSWKAMDGGHFISRGRSATKLLEENIHPQCKRCNGHLRGNGPGYAEFMIEMYGPHFIGELNQMARQEHKWSRPDLMVLIEELKQRERDLEARL